MKFKSQYLTIIWALIMLVLCGLPGDGLPNNPWLALIHFDKWIHIVLHAILAYLILRGIILQQGNITSKHYSWAIALSIAYGAFIEVLQASVFIHRSGDIVDVLANTAGAIIACILFKRLPRIFISK
jgi:VanZ family protein